MKLLDIREKYRKKRYGKMSKRAKRRRTGRIKSFAPLMELPGIRQKSGSRHTIHNTGSNICYTPYIVCNIPPNPAHICKLISIACLCRQFAHFWGSQLVASAICKLHLRLYFILPTKIHKNTLQKGEELDVLVSHFKGFLGRS